MSWSSDRTGERFLHTGIPLLLAGLIFPITTLPDMGFGWLLFWLCVSAGAIFGFGPSYWVLPTITLGESAAAAAVGLINIFGGLGGFVGPAIVGYLLTAKHSFSLGVFVLSLCLVVASLITFGLRGHIVKNNGINH